VGSSPTATPLYGSTGTSASTSRLWEWPPTSDGGGYWFVASDAACSPMATPASRPMGAKHLNEPHCPHGVDPRHGGYWLVRPTADLRVRRRPVYGSTGGIRLNKPIVE